MLSSASKTVRVGFGDFGGGQMILFTVKFASQLPVQSRDTETTSADLVWISSW